MTLQETFADVITRVTNLYVRFGDGEPVQSALDAATEEYNTLAELMGATVRGDVEYHAVDKDGEVWTVVKYQGGTYNFRGVLSRYQATHEAAKMAREFVY